MKKTHIIKTLKNKRIQGGIGTYVFIMFGITIMLYLFGFTNTFDSYQRTANLNDTTGSGNISDPNMQKDYSPLAMVTDGILSFIKNNPLISIGGIGAGIMIILAGVFLGGNAFSSFFAYLIPIGILAVFLNYFIFPLNPTDETFRSMEIQPGLSVSTILIIFFNLFFILSIIEFVRGTQT